MMNGTIYSVEIEEFDYHTHYRGEHAIISLIPGTRIIGITHI
jgi:hypothetical protein